MFDLKVHHKDKKGRLFKVTPYRRIESKAHGVWYERNGMKYNEAGQAIGLTETNPRSLQSFEISLETQGMHQRPVYTRIPNDDTPAPFLTVKDSQKVEEQQKLASKPEEVDFSEAEPFVNAVDAMNPVKKRRGRPRKVTE
jgi:hypothetical protein